MAEFILDRLSSSPARGELVLALKAAHKKFRLEPRRIRGLWDEYKAQALLQQLSPLLTAIQALEHQDAPAAAVLGT